MRAQFVLQEIWIGLRRNLTMTVSLVITVAIAMALLGTGLLIKLQVDSSKSYWHDRIEVSVFLCNKTSSNPSCNKTDATEQQKAEIKRDLEGSPVVAEVTYESKEQAFQRFKETFSSNPGLVQGAKVGDIPDSFRVRLSDPERFDEVTKLLANRAGVDQVVNEKEILDRFFKILNGLQWAAIMIAAIQVIAAVLLVANTVRLSAFNRRRETGIMRLVGASNLYIQLPFILEGAIAGLIGGLFAAILLVGSKIALIDQLQESLEFTSQLSWASVTGVIVFSICVGVLLCAAASFLSLRRYLRI
ncbi:MULTISPECIES: permease-like cell division protein FtsX [Thermomonospora]|uniref:Cell division protein FtsX n=1 Tax=Thermomonospora cellulosilytica TaxID=1411118 RepID=A0A7W3RC88_9ACTN|nr:MULTISPECIES: permease-like cell division protein FtsX [Thermomonospora]MBA9007847.1 cell division transport system permease protein [Thermomonospora cellulosilytica]